MPFDELLTTLSPLDLLLLQQAFAQALEVGIAADSTTDEAQYVDNAIRMLEAINDELRARGRCTICGQYPAHEPIACPRFANEGHAHG